MDIKNAEITFNNDFEEIVRAAYSRLVKYIALLLPSNLLATLNNIPRNKNSSNRPTQMIKAIAHIMISVGAADLFLMSGWIM